MASVPRGQPARPKVKKPAAAGLSPAAKLLARKKTGKAGASIATAQPSAAAPPIATAQPSAAAPPSAAPVDPFDAQTAAAVSQRYGQQESTIKQQQKDIPDWFANYQKILGDATAANAAAQAQAQAQLAGLQAATTGLGTKQASDLNAGAQADAQKRGATVDPGMLARAVQAGGVQRDSLASFGGLLTSQGAAQTARDAENSRYAGGQEVSARQSALKALTDLQADKGQFAVTTKQQLQDAAHKTALEDAAFGLDVQKTNDAATAASSAVNKYGYTAAQWSQMTPAERLLAQRKQKQATTIKPAVNPNANPGDHYGYTNSEWAGMTPAERLAAAKKFKDVTRAPKTPKVKKKVKPQYGLGSLSQDAENRTRGRIDKVVGQLKTGTQKDGSVLAPDGTTKLSGDAQILSTLQSAGLSSEEAYIALSLYRHGGKLSPAAVKKAHAIGVHVNSHYPLMTAPKPSALTGLSGGGTAATG